MPGSVIKPPILKLDATGSTLQPTAPGFPTTPNANILAALSRNTSVISSSSSSSSSSSLVLGPAPSHRTLSGATEKAQSPTTPRANRFPYSSSPQQQQRRVVVDSSDENDDLPPPNRVGNSANRRPSASTARGAARGLSPAAKRILSPNDFEFGAVLGEGAYSTVVKATHKATGTIYAAKILDKRHLVKHNKVKYANIEKDTLAKIGATGHPGVVRLHGTFHDSISLYFILDLVKNGDLMGMINRLGSLSITCARYYGALMVDTVDAMHQAGVLHRDLKPENILLDEGMRTKLTDFGSAKLLTAKDAAPRSNSFVGSAPYVSPELLMDSSAGKSADLWGIAVILYQAISGTLPFRGLSEYLTFEKVKHIDYTFPDGFPPDAQDLIQRIFVRDPEARLGALGGGGMAALKAHAFFQRDNWETLWTETAPPLEAGMVKADPAEQDREEEDVGAAWDALVLSHDDAEIVSSPVDPADGFPDPSTSPTDEVGNIILSPEDSAIPLAPVVIEEPRGLATPTPEIVLERAPVTAQVGLPVASADIARRGSSSTGTTTSSDGSGSVVQAITMGPIPEVPPARPTVASSSDPSPEAPRWSPKWSQFLSASEQVVRASPVHSRTRRGILPSRPRVLLLTNQPRLICLKEQKDALTLKHEVVFSVKSSLDEGQTKATGNVLQTVVAKGDRSFVVETSGKLFTYIAEDQNAASEWVEELARVQRSIRRHSNS